MPALMQTYYHVTTSDCVRAIRREGLTWHVPRRWPEDCYQRCEAIYMFYRVGRAVRWAKHMIDLGVARERIRLLELCHELPTVPDIHPDYGHQRRVSCFVVQPVPPTCVSRIASFDEARRWKQP